jgi:hypothetical protein
LEHRCILELRDYSVGHRARLLYNHLYFSDLPQEYKEEMLKEDFFLDIIRHEHFNPRLIEWLSAYSRLRQVSVQGYRAHVSALLEAPETIWAHAFHHQISDAARDVLLSFNTFGPWTDTVDLEPAFIALHRHNAARYNRRIRAGDFHRALQELEGAFLSYSKRHASYLNPSVRDFVAAVITNERETAEDLVNSAVRFKQFLNLWELAAARPDSVLRTVLTMNTNLLCRSLSRLLEGPSMRWEKMPDGTVRGYPVDIGYEGKVGFLAEVAAVHESTQLAAMASQLTDRIVGGWEQRVIDFGSVLRLLAAIAENRWFLDHGGREVYQRFLKGVLDELAFARADDWLDLLAFPAKAFEWSDADENQLKMALRQYEQNGARNERYDYTTVDELTAFRDSLDKLRNEYGLDLEYQIERLDEDIAEREERSPNLEKGSGYGRDRTPVRQDLITDDEVREMFRTLRDGI